MGLFSLFATGVKSPLTIKAALTMKAAAAGDDGDGDNPATFDIVANTGEPMRIPGVPIPVILDIAGASFFKDKTPVVMDHDESQRIGFTTAQNIDVAGGVITASGQALSSPIAQQFVTDARAGFPFESSIGARVIKAQRVRKGQSVTVNGKQYQSPIMTEGGLYEGDFLVARKSRIFELTTTAIGADRNTSVTVAASQAGFSKSGVNEMGFNDWLRAKHFDPETLEEGQLTSLRAMFDAEQKAAAEAAKADADKGKGKGTGNPATIQASADDEKARTEARRKADAAEFTRQDTIRAAFARHPDVKTVMVGETETPIATIQASAIADGTDHRDIELLLMRAARPEARGPAIHISANLDGDQLSDAIACSVARGFGMKASFKGHDGASYGWENQFDEKTLEASDRKELKGQTLHSMMALTIRCAGEQYLGPQNSDAFFKAYCEAATTIKAAGGPFSTLIVTNILENVGNKMLLARFQMQASTWQQICNVKNLNDFKAHSLYRLDENLGYQRIGPQGSLKSGTLTDTKRTVQADTYGRLISLSRQDIRNDDLGAFAQIMNGLADGSTWAKEAAAYVQLLGQITGGVFFSAANANIITTDLSIQGVTDAEQLFVEHVGAGGKPIGMMPNRLIVGTQDSVLADQINNDLTLLTPQAAADPGNAGAFAPNPHAGKYGKVMSAYLSNVAIRTPDGDALVGQDNDQWLLIGDPAVMAVVQMGLLDGRAFPIIEQGETSFDTLGIMWRGYDDFGVAEGDTEAGVLSTGTGAGSSS